MGARRRLIAAVAIVAASWPFAAVASGPGETAPWYVDQFGGPRTDLERVYAGRLGVVMARAPRPQLYIAWRLLHGQAVGSAAGEALSMPCCNGPSPARADAPATGVDGWLMARKVVPGAPDVGGFLPTERNGPNYTSIANCFPDAFDTAAATLKARAVAYGLASPEIAQWLAAQDAVFEACSDATAAMPSALQPSAPDWLKADRAYQDAAFAFYNGRTDEAADRFAAIGLDAVSPWRPTAIYLRARALEKSALNQPTPAAFDKARAAIAVLIAAPPGTFGRDRARDMLRVLSFRDQPQHLMAEIEQELSRPSPPPDVAVSFRDLSTLFDTGKGRPEALDWMETIASGPSYQDDPTEGRDAKLAHARERWAATHDQAWLLAALSLADPAAPGSDALVADARKVSVASAAWLTAQFQLVRLTEATAPPPQTRARLDAILARSDLSISDRNVFTAQRAQVASDVAEFAHLALRTRLCADQRGSGCARELWLPDSYQPANIYDGERDKGSVGFGEDARATIDRLPLADRIDLSRNSSLPAALQLDLALTSYGRAVLLQDEQAVDLLAGDLISKFPRLQADWRRIVYTRPGSDKTFAEYLVLAKIPGLRPDLVNYVRPEGDVRASGQSWVDWIIMPAGGRSSVPPSPPPLAAYQQGGAGPSVKTPDSATDLACLGECGQGAAPLRTPDFAQAHAAVAAAERTRLVTFDALLGQPRATPSPGSVAAWDAMLTYLRAHPTDLRAPEALYWLVRVGHFDGSHDHSGKRAFRLLHLRYPRSSWAKRTRYYYD